jgi:hypothetical protein
MVRDLIVGDNDGNWVVWCDTDLESDALKSRLPGAIEVRGSLDADEKERRLGLFADGSFRVMITKPSIAGMGLNWQHASKVAFVGRSFSYEAWYQAVRRCWRFGQTKPVDVHLIVAEGEDQIGRVIDRKAEAHAEMKEAMIAASRRAIAAKSEVRKRYVPKFNGRLPSWLTSCGA